MHRARPAHVIVRAGRVLERVTMYLAGTVAAEAAAESPGKGLFLRRLTIAVYLTSDESSRESLRLGRRTGA